MHRAKRTKQADNKVILNLICKAELLGVMAYN